MRHYSPFDSVLFTGADDGFPRVIANLRPGAFLDGQYFVDDPDRTVQLRPRLAADISPYRHKQQKGEMVLATRGVSPRVNCFIRPPKSLRTNTPEAVEWCVARLERDQPVYGKIFRTILNGEIPIGMVRDPTDLPGANESAATDGNR